MVSAPPSRCSSADTSAPSGWLPLDGCASCCGSPSSTMLFAAPLTATTSASDFCPASSTNSTSTVSRICSRAHSHEVPATTSNSSPTQRFEHLGVVVRALDDLRRAALVVLGLLQRADRRRRVRARPAHLVEQVADHRVGVRGDPDPLALAARARRSCARPGTSCPSRADPGPRGTNRCRARAAWAAGAAAGRGPARCGPGASMPWSATHSATRCDRVAQHLGAAPACRGSARAGGRPRTASGRA